jgi:hypothetical protein
MDEELPNSEETEALDQVDEQKGAAEVRDTSQAAKKGSYTWLIVAGIGLVVILIVVGLFLPPISIGERLGLTGEETDLVTDDTGSDETETSISEGSMTVSSSDEEIKIDQISSDEFLAGEAGNKWEDALAALPNDRLVASDFFELEYDDSPVGVAQIDVPEEAQPQQTLDLFGWNGESWVFVPTNYVDDQGDQLVSNEGVLPLALVLLQSSPPAEIEIGAEILPTQILPPAVLPYLTEVTAGTLTLAGDGSLMGEAVSVPTGGYRQLVRATNTGAIVDVVSLATLLSDVANQDKNIEQLIDAATTGGFAGVNLDYQGVQFEQADAFTAFAHSLAQSLHDRNLDLVVTLEAPVLLNETWDTAGQDWAALGAEADTIYAQMPLDPTEYGDNQIAEQIIDWATGQVDRGKLTILYSVNAVDAVGESHREVDQNQALAEFGEITFVDGSDEIAPGDSVEIMLSGSADALAWDPASLSYKYSYEQGGQPHDVWLGSEALVTHRGRFADRYNLRGVAVRGLGSLAAGDGYGSALSSIMGTDEAPQPASAAIVWKVLDDSGDVIASSTGDEMRFQWEGTNDPGEYVIQVDFAQGDTVSNLAMQPIVVADLLAAVEPTPESEETAEPDAPVEPEATATPEPEATAAQPSPIDLGDADAAANTPTNVRSGPGLGYGIIAGLQSGEKVSLIGRNDDSTWLNIDLPGEQVGWVFAQLLAVNSGLNVNDLAVIEVEPPVVAGGGDGGASAPPPVIAPAGGGSFELGGQTHTLANPALMSSAGMNWVKFQHKWGPGDSPDAVAGRIQQAHANGMKVLLSMPGANAYPSSIDFNGYVEFLRGVAALGPDAIEVWNEMNIDFEWPAGQIDPASYVNNMLAPAYNAIKSANPSVMVISGAPAPTGFDNGTNAWSDARYMAGVAAAGGGNYMDCIGVHHNAGATSPNSTSGHPAGGEHYSWYFWPTLNMYYNSFGGARPVCFTEVGYLSGQDFGGVPSRFSWAANTTVAQHSQWLAEAASLSANSGKVRMMIIFNVDFTHWGDDPQAGYAMLRPDGSCPSCGPLGQVMGR